MSDFLGVSLKNQIKKKAQARVLPCEFYRILNGNYFVEHLRMGASEKDKTLTLNQLISKDTSEAVVQRCFAKCCFQKIRSLLKLQPVNCKLL